MKSLLAAITIFIKFIFKTISTYRLHLQSSEDLQPNHNRIFMWVVCCYSLYQTQSQKEQRWQRNKGMVMFRNVNNVCLGVTANVVYGITSSILSGLVDVSVLDDPLITVRSTTLTYRPALFIYHEIASLHLKLMLGFWKNPWKENVVSFFMHLLKWFNGGEKKLAIGIIISLRSRLRL